MKNHELYKQLKQIACNYTVQQAENLSPEELRSLSKADNTVTGTFINNMKQCLIDNLQAKQDEADEKKRDEVLDAGFPDWRQTKFGKEITNKLFDAATEVE